MTDSPRSQPPAGLPIAILGVPFDNVTTAQAIARIQEMIASRQPHYLVTANVDFLVQAQDDVELRRILVDAHLVVADGMPLVWASRWLGNPLPERVTGSGMTPLLLARAELEGWRVFFLGGTEQSVAQAAARTRAKHPRLQLVGAYSPPFKPLLEMDHQEILGRLREARPDLLLVAFGCPKQEKWLNMHYRAAGVPVAIGVGATIDFLAGTMKRAPRWMQQTGLEWLFRLLQEPRRLFRRYVTGLSVFGGAILRQLRELRVDRTASAPGPVEVKTTADARAFMVILPSRLTTEAAHANAHIWRQLSGGSKDLVLDAGHIEAIDSTGVAVLARLQKAMRESGRESVLVAPTRALTRALDLMKLSASFAQAADGPSALALLAARRRETSVAASSPPSGGAAVIRWQGEITAGNVDAVTRTTESHLAEVSGRLVIDLSAVRFIDSSGIGLMVRLHKQAHARNLDLAFVGATEGVSEVARRLRLEHLLRDSKP